MRVFNGKAVLGLDGRVLRGPTYLESDKMRGLERKVNEYEQRSEQDREREAKRGSFGLRTALQTRTSS